MSTMPGFCLALLILFASVQALTIDDLLTPQAPVAVGPSSSASTLIAGSIILGGDREIEMINGASVGTLTGDVTAGQFTVSFAGGLAPLQTTGSLRWDGTGNPANTVDLDLAPVDLTAGGATGLFYTSVATVNHLVGLQVWTGVGNTPADACSAQLFGSVGTLTQGFPFATLPAPGGGACDMTNVFALELSVQPLGPGDVIISNIVTDGLAGVCQTYSPSQTTDGCGSFCDTLGTITQTKADFGCNPTDLVQINDVNAVVSFLKTSGTCASPDTGFAFHDEANYRLDSGAGINVILANPSTWSGGTVMGGNANVIFDQSASSAPSGTPTTGTFLPNGGNLNALNGQLYCGDVSHSLVAGDTGGGDPLCTSDFCVDVSATCVPNSPPSLSGCQAPSVNLNMDAGVCCATASFGTPTATDPDPCGSPSVSQTFGAGSGACVSDGASVQFTATDNFGATAQCSWTYSVFDVESPSITCPADEAVTNDPGQCSAVVSFSDPSVTDNCPGSTFSGSGILSGGTYPVGSSTNTYTGSDGAGNDVTCTMSVVVSDSESPTITCPADVNMATDPGNCGAVVSFPDPVVTDNCPGSTFSGSGLLSGGNYPVGFSVNVYTGMDATGRTAVCSMLVEVFDGEAPTVVSCPPVSVNNDAGICGAVVSFPTPTFGDNCAIASVAQQSGLTSGSTFPVGSTNNGFLATDSSSLTNTCTVAVTVSDTENPVFSGCSNINRNTDLNQCSATVAFSPSASDNCGISSTSQTGGPSSGSSFPVGPTVVSFQAQDLSLNTETCSFTINVSDNQNPVVAQCPASQTVNNAAGTCAAVVTYTVGESDNCPGATLAQNSGFASGASFPVGTTSNQYVATDASGNVSPPCNFDVTVRDVESPSIVTCPTDINLNNAPGACSAVATYTVQTTDNCPGAVFLNYLSGSPSGSSFPVGTTPVQIQAVDGFGNVSPTCAFNVRVADVESPTITCPADLSVGANADGCTAIVNFSYVTTDNCPGTLVVTSTHQSGDNFVGITDVTGTATDTDGNSASCTFRITVEDSVAPEISCFSATANTSPGLCTATVFFRDPDAFDVCGVDITRTGTAISGETYAPGSYSSTFTATDPSGNFDRCVSEVDVFDIEPPVVTGCPADITVSNPSGCDEPVTWDDSSVTRTDNCGVVSSGQSHASGSTFPRGLTTVSYTATDSAGNVGQCSFIVRVVDNEQISYSGCPVSFTVPSSCSDSGTPVDWEEPVISRVECLTYQARNFAPGSRMPDGVTSISYTAVADEEWATCIFEITVEACPAESGGNRPPGAIGTIDLDGDGYYSDAPLLEWRDCCDSPEDHCDDPYLVNPGAFEIAANDQQDSCRGISETNDADGHIGGCDRNFVFANDFQLVGPLIPSEQTNEAVWAMDLCEFKEDDDDPSWGFDEQQTMIFSLSNGTRNGYDIGIVGPAATQAAVLDHYGGIVPARGDFMLAISSGTARDETTGGHQSPVGATTGNSITNLPPRFLDSNAATFIEDCGGEPYAVGVDSIRAHFRIRQPTNMNAFSFQALYMDFELEAAQGSYPALDGTCDADRKSWFLAIKSDSNTGVSGNFAGDATGRSFNSFNANPAFWSQCNDYGDYAAGLCREGSTSLELTGFTGASNWTPIGTSAEPGETFSLEFVTFDGQDGDNDVTVLLDDFFPITEARTAGSSAWASQPWGYQYTADLEMVNFGVAGGSPVLAKTVTSVSLEFTLRNWGPEEANDVTIAFTPPLGARFTAAKDSTGASLSCVTQPAAAPYVDNGFVKCKWATNAPMANQATLSGSLSFALDLDCAACPQHTRQMRFRLTSTLSSIDRQLSNNYLTTDVVFV